MNSNKREKIRSARNVKKIIRKNTTAATTPENPRNPAITEKIRNTKIHPSMHSRYATSVPGLEYIVLVLTMLIIVLGGRNR